MPTITATDFHSNLYRLLEQVQASGEPLLINRSGRTLEVRLSETPTISPLARLQPHPGTIVDSDAALASPWDESAWAASWDAHRP